MLSRNNRDTMGNMDLNVIKFDFIILSGNLPVEAQTDTKTKVTE